VPSVEYDEGFKHGFLGHMKYEGHESMMVRLKAGELISFE